MTPELRGVYVRPDRTAVLDAMERWCGERHAVQVVFTPWDPDALDECFERLLPGVWAAGRIPLVTWEPFVPGASTEAIAARVVAGEFDDYVDRWTDRLRAWLAGPDGESEAADRRLYLRPGHEMNGDWYPWAPASAGSPDEYVAMWRRVHDRVTARLPAGRCQWVWCVNHADVGGCRAEACYPGDDYVDWVGVDGFNWGTSREWSAWRSPADVFGEMLDRVGELTDKPVCIPEVGCSSATAAGHDPERKAEWIGAAAAFFEGRARLQCWFNQDKETDWAVFGGERGTHLTATGRPCYAAYRDALGAADTVASGPGAVGEAAFRGE